MCVSLYWLCLLSSSGTQKKRFDRKWAHSGKCWWTRRALSPERDHRLSQCKLPSIRFYICDVCMRLSSQNAMLALIFLPTEKPESRVQIGALSVKWTVPNPNPGAHQPRQRLSIRLSHRRGRGGRSELQIIRTSFLHCHPQDLSEPSLFHVSYCLEREQ